MERYNALSFSVCFFCAGLLLSLILSFPAWSTEQEEVYKSSAKCVENTKKLEKLNTEILNGPDIERMFAQSAEEDYQVYQEQNYGDNQDFEGNSDEPANDGFFRNIQDYLDTKPKSDKNFGEDTMPPEERRPTTEDPYAGGAVQKLLGDKPELLITDIVMRNPKKRELIVHDELKPRDWVFEVRVQNVGKIPVNGVEILVAVGNKRLKTSIAGTIEYNKSARSFVHMRPSQKFLSKKSVEVTAIADPYNNIDEANEDNNLFTKRFVLKR